MGDNFKLDVNIPQKEIEKMAKQVIREIIESKIEEAMKNINVEEVIGNKINSIDSKFSKMVEKTINKKVDDLKYGVQYEFDKAVRSIILEEVQKKPISGNVYLNISSKNIRTDYDDDY